MKTKNLTRAIRATAALGLLFAAALLAACSQQASGPGTESVPKQEESTQPEKMPTIKIVAPSEGAEVPAGTVTAIVETTGLKFVMPSNTNVPGEGHVHFTLDDRPFVMSTEPTAELTDVEPGEHTLVAELVQNDTQSFDPPIKQQITFTVK